jgi:hypothetical protein
MTPWFNCNTDIIEKPQLIDGYATYSTKLLSDIQGNLYCLMDPKLHEKWYLLVNKIQGDIKAEFAKLNDEWYLQHVTLWDEEVHIIRYGKHYIDILSKEWDILWLHYRDPCSPNNCLPFMMWDQELFVFVPLKNNRVSTDKWLLMLDSEKIGHILSKKLWDEEVFVSKIHKNEHYVKITTKEWTNLWRYYLDPENNSRILSKKLWDEEVYVSDLRESGNYAKIKTKEWKNKWRYYLESTNAHTCMPFFMWDNQVTIGRINGNRIPDYHFRVDNEKWKMIWRFCIDPENPNHIESKKMWNEEVYVTEQYNIPIASVKTKGWINLGSVLLEPDNLELLVMKKLWDKDVLITDREENYVHVISKEWMYMWRYSIDPNNPDTCLPFQLWNQDVKVWNIQNNSIKVETVDWKQWVYLLDPKNNAQVRLFQWLPVTHYDSNTNIITVMSNNKIPLQLQYTQ